MEKPPLYHETVRRRFGSPAWWFGAPVVAFAYVLLAPRLIPDLVTIPETLPRNLMAPVRWLVGLLIGVAVLAAVQLLVWLRRRRR